METEDGWLLSRDKLVSPIGEMLHLFVRGDVFEALHVI